MSDGDFFEDLSPERKQFMLDMLKDKYGTKEDVSIRVDSGDVGAFLRKYGSDMAGKNVEEVVRKFVDYLKEK
jgi:hypothetical protein